MGYSKSSLFSGKQALEEPSLASAFRPNTYLHRFFREKSLKPTTYHIVDSSGLSHSIPTQVVIEAIASTSGEERKHIEGIIRKIDFSNGDLHHFLRHLAQALGEQYEGALR